jgi:hypothetical protein
MQSKAMKSTVALMALAAVMAIGAIGAASASAALPELVKAGTSEVVKGEITGKSTASLLYEMANGTKLKCESVTLKGGKAVTTKETKTNRLVFTGCKGEFETQCNSAGKKAGEIESVALTGKIGYITIPEASKEVGLELRPSEENLERTKPLVTYECPGLSAKTEWIGTVIGLFGHGQHNVSTKSLNLVFERGSSRGVQEIRGIEGGFAPETYLKGNLNGSFEQMNWQDTITVNFAESVELKA